MHEDAGRNRRLIGMDMAKASTVVAINELTVKRINQAMDCLEKYLE